MSDESYSFDDLVDLYGRESLVDEANRTATIRTGSYYVTARTATPRIADGRTEFEGRKMASIGFDVTLDDGKVVRKSASVSHEERRVIVTENGSANIGPEHDDYSVEHKLDNKSSLWYQLLKVVDPKVELNLPDQIEAIKGTDFKAYIMEAFKKEDHKTIYKADDMERKALLKDGYEPFNYFRNFKKP